MKNKEPQGAWVEDESWPAYGLRRAAQGAARGAEGFLGGTGNAIKGAIYGAELANKGLEKGINFVGKKVFGHHKDVFPEKERPPRNQKLLDYIPDSGTINKHVTKNIESVLPENYLSPHNESEKEQGDVISSLASFFSPGLWSKGTSFGKQLKTAGKIVGSGTAAKKAAKSLSFDEPAQAIAELGGSLLGPWAGRSLVNMLKKNHGIADTKDFHNWLKEDLKKPSTGNSTKMGPVLMTSLAESTEGKRAIDDYTRKLYKDAIEAVPENYRVSLAPVEPTLRKLDKILSAGFETPSKEALSKPVKGIQNILKKKGKNISAFEATELKRNLNELVYSSDIPDRTKKLLQPIAHEVQNNVLHKIAKDHPEFAKHFEADEIWKATNVGSQVKDFIKKNVNINKFATPLTLAAMGIGHKYGLGALLKGTAGGFAAKEAFLVADQFFSSGAVRKYYKEAMTAALKRNAPQTARSLHKLDTAIKAEEDKRLGTGAWVED
jgi:hypothetical protein